jgi:hypothetical protein
MTGEKRMFSSYEKNEDPQRAITFGDGNQGLVKGLGKIAISPYHSISNVFLVYSLEFLAAFSGFHQTIFIFLIAYSHSNFFHSHSPTTIRPYIIHKFDSIGDVWIAA